MGADDKLTDKIVLISTIYSKQESSISDGYLPAVIGKANNNLQKVI